MLSPGSPWNMHFCNRNTNVSVLSLSHAQIYCTVTQENSPIFSCAPSPRSCLSHIQGYATSEMYLHLKGFQVCPKNPKPPIFLSHSSVGSAVKMLWEKLNIFFSTSHTPFPPHSGFSAPSCSSSTVSHLTASGTSQCLPLSSGRFKDLPLTLPEELQFGQFASVSSSHHWEATGHLSVHFAVTENKELLTFPSQNAAGSHLPSNFLGNYSFAQLGQ